MLTQLRADTREEHGELERFRDIVVGAGIKAEDLIRIRHIAS